MGNMHTPTREFSRNISLGLGVGGGGGGVVD